MTGMVGCQPAEAALDHLNSAISVFFMTSYPSPPLPWDGRRDRLSDMPYFWTPQQGASGHSGLGGQSQQQACAFGDSIDSNKMSVYIIGEFLLAFRRMCSPRRRQTGSRHADPPA